MNLVERSYQKELLDQDNIPFEDIKQNLQELNFINTWLGGHQITIDGFSRLVENRKRISVCEIGCGGGDNLLAINNWCKKKKIELVVYGIDIKKECIDFAKTRSSQFNFANWIISDYKKVHFDIKPDIIFSSLFCHHFNTEQLLIQLQWMKENSLIGFFINDLHRNLIAYHSIKILIKIFSRSYLVKNDAPLSVARGFTRIELSKMCDQARLENVQVVWKWAFRYLVIYNHGSRGII